MIKNIFEKLGSLLPLTIVNVEINGALLVLTGSFWQISFRCAWRIFKDNKVIVACYDEDLSRVKLYMTGVNITGIERADDLLNEDPIFVLSNGLKIGFFATHSTNSWNIELDETLQKSPEIKNEFGGNSI